MAALPIRSPSFFDQGISTFMQCFKSPAVKLFTKHLQSNPKHFECWMYRGICFEILGEKANAIADYTQAESYGTPCEQMVVQGLKYRVQGNDGEATAMLEQATKRYPLEPISWHFYGVIRYNQGLADDTTAAALRKAVDLKYRRSGVTRYFLGNLLASMGKNAEAIEHLRAGIALSPTSTINYIALGDSLFQTGSYEEAKEHYLTALGLNKTQIAANLGLVKIYVHEGNYDAAAVQVAIYIEASYSTQNRASKLGSGKGNHAKSARGGSGGMGGSGGGSGGGGGDGSDGSDDEDPIALQGETWKEVKRKATARAEYGDIHFRKVTIDGADKWVSFDRARHAGSAFKVWVDKRSRIEFESSYDGNLKKMDGKHESNEGKFILKSQMKIVDLGRKK